jgi:hypothetical protein
MISGSRDGSFGFPIRGAGLTWVHEIADTNSLGQEQGQDQQQ